MSIDLRSKSSAATNAHRVLRITASNLPEQPCLNGQNVTCFFTWCPVSHCPLAMPFVHQGFFNTGPLKNSIKTFVTIKVCSMFLTGRPPRCKSRSPMSKKIRGSQSTESDHCFRKQCFQWGLRIRSRRPSRPVHEVGLLKNLDMVDPTLVYLRAARTNWRRPHLPRPDRRPWSYKKKNLYIYYHLPWYLPKRRNSNQN